VRELQNVIERSVIVCETDEFTARELLSVGPVATIGSRCPARSPPRESGHRGGAAHDRWSRVRSILEPPRVWACRDSTLESEDRALGINKEPLPQLNSVCCPGFRRMTRAVSRRRVARAGSTCCAGAPACVVRAMAVLKIQYTDNGDAVSR